MLKAKVVHKQGNLTPNGREKKAQVRMGKKGAGKQIEATVIYWPWSARSVEEMDRIISNIAIEHDLELVEQGEN